MQTVSREDLGHGVAVETGADGIVVTSRGTPLPWRGPAARAPGTAVVWREEMFEVVAGGEVVDGAARWTLRPWGAAAARGIFVLDASGVAGIAQHAAERGRAQATHDLLTIIEPIAGLAPRAWQERWQRENGFHALRATFVGGLITAGVGVVGAMQLMASMFGGAGFLPDGMAWLGDVAPILVGEGAYRVACVVAFQRPAGSMVTWPLGFVRRG